MKRILHYPDTMTMYEDYPDVIEKDGKFYIDGNGANRLIMADSGKLS